MTLPVAPLTRANQPVALSCGLACMEFTKASLHVVHVMQILALYTLLASFSAASAQVCFRYGANLAQCSFCYGAPRLLMAPKQKTKRRLREAPSLLKLGTMYVFYWFHGSKSNGQNMRYQLCKKFTYIYTHTRASERW